MNSGAGNQNIATMNETGRMTSVMTAACVDKRLRNAYI